MRGPLVVLGFVVMAGCDSNADRPFTARDLDVVTGVCVKNGGLNQAERVQPMIGSLEWRIDCADGARFVLPAS